LLLFSLFVFSYYTLWAMILPFIDESNSIHDYFPPRRLAIIIPLFLLVTGVSAICGFIAFVLIRSSKKQKKT
ncbi:dolichol phosphate-mannose biosynthesis regulatory, partial [Zopfochytrium polystomum]